MKKKVNFEKSFTFPMMIGEITAISLEQDLKFIDESCIEGNLLLKGKYKLTEASRLEEDFDYKIPIDISLIEKLDLNTAKVDITDFTYEIVNGDEMNCHIELLVEGLEVLDEVRECDGDINNVDESIVENVVEEKGSEEDMINDSMDIISNDDLLHEDNELEETVEKVEEDNSFFNFSDDKETFGTFIVYIVRQNETVNSIIEKYKTSIEELEKYNDLNDLSVGSKLIIPILNE